MTKQDIIDKLKELGIKSTNCYPKNTFKKGEGVYVGMFKGELEDDFYFYSAFAKTLYHLPKQENLEDYETEEFQGKLKYLIPLDKAQSVWNKEEVYEELMDENISKLTTRQFACILLKIPESGLPWLDALIRKRI
jgi:hypothetical protein